MKKNSGQILIYVAFVIIVFASTTLIIATLTTRELEIREIGEQSLKAQYAAEAGDERARYYINTTTDSISEQVTIDEGSSEIDKNPLENGFTYKTVITPNGKDRFNGSGCSCPSPEENCCCIGPNNYCIDSWGESPQPQ